MTTDEFRLLFDGRQYTGWTDVHLGRGLKKMCSEFNISLANAWPAGADPWPITPFKPCVLMFGADVLLTGYTDTLVIDLDPHRHGIRVTGRSKTGDLTDCMPDLASGQFNGYDLAQIARAICQPFGIEVVVETDVGPKFPDATMQRTETAFAFLNRLGKLAGVLLTDDGLGRLVLTRAGDVRATDSLQEGVNVTKVVGTQDGSKRHSIWIVKGQHGIGGAGPTADTGGTYNGFGGIYTPATPGTVTARPLLQQRATAIDDGVPRYRPHVTLAEGQLDQAGMQARANWQMRHARGLATKVSVSTPGWRQTDGKLWLTNQVVATHVPTAGMDLDLLTAEVDYVLDDREGHMTHMRLGPAEAYTPDPGEVKLRKHGGRGGHGKKGGGIDWTGFGGNTKSTGAS